MRLFFALWAPAATAEALHAWAKAAQRSTGGRVTRAETIHLTLAFLGETPPERLDAAIAAGRRVRAPRSTLKIERAKWWKHNRIVWVGPENTDASLTMLSRPSCGPKASRSRSARSRRTSR